MNYIPQPRDLLTKFQSKMDCVKYDEVYNIDECGFNFMEHFGWTLFAMGTKIMQAVVQSYIL